ncbi:MAG: hypothetical protein A3E78_00360 [Alphaproteobacteria bacterium RIFCSPHIGHO2_12_FULL_63_12]|nr:MAG: hypothetical protein A3E78_00360 [Alphaproteobacteria bacterium RIFCSPHIGHO2_12_FULL_63_12]
MSNREIGKLSSALIALLEQESKALRKRNYELIASLAHHKEKLAEAVELAVSRIAGGGDDALVEMLSMINEKAKRNAEQLAAVKQGFLDARRRIEAIAEAEAKSGLYSAGGQRIAAARSAVASRSV